MLWLHNVVAYSSFVQASCLDFVKNIHQCRWILGIFPNKFLLDRKKKGTIDKVLRKFETDIHQRKCGMCFLKNYLIEEYPFGKWFMGD